MSKDVALRAIANERRLQVLDWSKRPGKHLPVQAEGDLVEDDVCGLFIARKLKITQPSASKHLSILADAGLVRGKRINQWTFYKRDEKAIARVKRIVAGL